MNKKTIAKVWLGERIKWWLYHPRFELIYLLGGIPEEHQNTLHYRNINSIFVNFREKIGNKDE